MKAQYLLSIVILTFFVLGCQPRNQNAAQSFAGTLELTEHALGARVAGRVATLSVEEGEEVKKGQLLATLDRYEQARKDYERTKNLFEQGGATQQSLEYAALALEDQQVIAPLDGVVLVKVHEVGETVAAGSAVVVIGDRSQLWVRIFVPEGWINRIQLGQQATVSLDNINQSFKGRVSFIAPQAEFTPRNVQTPEERVTQAFAVKVVLEEMPAFLRPGVAADVVIAPLTEE